MRAIKHEGGKEGNALRIENLSNLPCSATNEFYQIFHDKKVMVNEFTISEASS